MEIYKTERLYVKEINVNELTDIVMEWFNDENLMKYYTNSKKRITRKSLIENIQEGKSSKINYTFGIYFKENNTLIGTIKLGPINHVHKISDLVILLGDKAYHGKGLAQEAIHLGHEVAFKQFDLRKLFGGMYMENKSSIKSYTRSGWLVEGLLKGHYWVDSKPQDRVLVGMFNPKYFTDEALEKIKTYSDHFLAKHNLK